MKGKIEDRRLGFTSDVNDEFTLKGAKCEATKPKEGKVSFGYAIVKGKKSTRPVLVSIGDLQGAAIDAGLKGDALPFPNVKIGDEVDCSKVTPNENFEFAIANNKIIVKAA